MNPTYTILAPFGGKYHKMDISGHLCKLVLIIFPFGSGYSRILLVCIVQIKGVCCTRLISQYVLFSSFLLALLLSLSSFLSDMSTVAMARIHSGQDKTFLTRSSTTGSRPHPPSSSPLGYSNSTSRLPHVSPPPSSTDVDYEEIEDTISEGSYHSEGDDIAEYWDPYCKY